MGNTINANNENIFASLGIMPDNLPSIYHLGSVLVLVHADQLEFIISFVMENTKLLP